MDYIKKDEEIDIVMTVPWCIRCNPVLASNSKIIMIAGKYRCICGHAWEIIPEPDPNKSTTNTPTPSHEGKDALAFAEWISKEGYISTTLEAEAVQLWQKNIYNHHSDTFVEGEELTCEQLYSLYTESLKQQK